MTTQGADQLEGNADTTVTIMDNESLKFLQIIKETVAQERRVDMLNP